MTEPPTIYEFSSLRAYLASFVEFKRSERASWTLGSWAKRLGLKHTATLSRVINGDREPGDALLAKLCDYFELDAMGEEYLGCLALVEKIASDSSVRRLVERRLAEIRESASPLRREESGDEQPLLCMSNSTVLGIEGLGDFAATKEVLEQRGVEPVSFGDRSYISLTISRYPESTVGPYCEFIAGISSRVIGSSDLRDVGISYPLAACNSSQLVTFGMTVWGNHYSLGDVSLAEESGNWRAKISVDSHSTEFETGPFEGIAPENTSLDYSGFGNISNRNTRFRIHSRFGRRQRPFDPAMDRIDATHWPELRELLENVVFEPTTAILYQPIDAQVFAPYGAESAATADSENS